MKTRYFPPSLTQVITNNFGIECRYNETTNTAILYAGASYKAVFYLIFRSKESMMNRINTTIDSILASNNAKLKKKQILKELNANLNASDHFNIGDIIVNSWGYEQTNVDFYQVVRITKKKIEVHQIMSERDTSKEVGFMSEYVLPVKDSFVKNGVKYNLLIKATNYNNEPDIRIASPESFYHFHLWDGNSEYTSSYA